MTKRTSTIGFHFHQGNFTLTAVEIEVINELKAADDSHISFEIIGLGLNLTGDEVCAIILDLDRRGILTIEWPADLKNLLN